MRFVHFGSFHILQAFISTDLDKKTTCVFKMILFFEKNWIDRANVFDLTIAFGISSVGESVCVKIGKSMCHQIRNQLAWYKVYVRIFLFPFHLKLSAILWLFLQLPVSRHDDSHKIWIL